LLTLAFGEYLVAAVESPYWIVHCLMWAVRRQLLPKRRGRETDTPDSHSTGREIRYWLRLI